MKNGTFIFIAIILGAILIMSNNNTTPSKKNFMSFTTYNDCLDEVWVCDKRATDTDSCDYMCSLPTPLNRNCRKESNRLPNYAYSDCFQYTSAVDECYTYWSRKKNIDVSRIEYINSYFYTKGKNNPGIPYDSIFDELIYKCGTGLLSVPPYPACVDNSDCPGSFCNTDINVQVNVSERSELETVHQCTDGRIMSITEYNNWYNLQETNSAKNDVQAQCGTTVVRLITVPAHTESLPGIMQCGVQTPLQYNEECLSDSRCNDVQYKNTTVPAVYGTKYYYLCGGNACGTRGVSKVYLETWQSCTQINSDTSCAGSYGWPPSNQIYLQENYIINNSYTVTESYNLFNDSIERVCLNKQCIIPQCKINDDCTGGISFSYLCSGNELHYVVLTPSCQDYTCQKIRNETYVKTCNNTCDLTVQGNCKYVAPPVELIHDYNYDGIVDTDEVTQTFNNWKNNNTTRQDVGTAIEEWANG